MTRETEGGLCEEAGTAGGSVKVEDSVFRVLEPRETLSSDGRWKGLDEVTSENKTGKMDIEQRSLMFAEIW